MGHAQCEIKNPESFSLCGDSFRNPQSAIGKVLLKTHFHGKLQKVQG